MIVEHKLADMVPCYPLLSTRRNHAIAVFDCIETAKGPNLGTNFALTSRYVVLAHY